VAENTKKKAAKGLGKGLDALMRPGVFDVTSRTPSALPEVAGERILMLNPEAIRPNPKQPRRVFDEDSLAELADSILKNGIQEPLIVRQINGEYQIVCGERRCRAAVMAGLNEVPAICRDVSDMDMLKFGLIENIQREDLNAIELALAYRQLMEEYDWTQERLSEEVGKKRATVANTLRLLQLPEVIQKHVSDGFLSMGHARALASIPSSEKQIALARKIIANGLSVRQAEQMAATVANKAPQQKTARPSKLPHLVELEDKLRRRLGAKVAVKHQENNRGRIEIEYFSLEELDRILYIITNR